MKIIKVAVDLFNRDPEEERREREEMYQNVFDNQDEWAAKSSVFKRVLDSEIKDDLDGRYLSTNSPRSKTRNALITRTSYETQEEWEKELLTNPYYGLNQQEQL